MLTIIDTIMLQWADPEHTQLFGKVITEEYGPAEIIIREDYDLEWGRNFWVEALSGEHGPILEYVAQPVLTPEEKRERMPNLTARQLRLGLLQLGKLQDVPIAIAALLEPERSQAQIEWDYASEFRRLHPLIVQLIPNLGLTDEQVDPVWEQFAQV